VLDNALHVLEGLDRRAVLAHAHALGGELIAGLRRIGRRVITPDAEVERAGNVCFLADDGVALAARLAERDVLVWGGDGRIRISAHVHNDESDVRRCLDALAELAVAA
jgi:cysteine desulfurase/selenocysteine lyase